MLVVDEERPAATVFRHALTRDAIYGDTLPRERVRIHAAYARGAVRRPGARRGRRRPRPPRARAALDGGARHPARAAGVGRGGAAGGGVRAGRGAAPPRARAGAVAERARRATSAAAWTSSRCCAGPASSAYAAGALDRSLALFDEALAELEPGADPERRALLIEAARPALIDLGRIEEATVELERAAALLPAEPPTVARAAVLGSLAPAAG